MKQTTPTEEFPVEHISIHGHQIGYRRGGEGPVLLLLHGIAGSSLTWVPAMSLLQSDYTVLAPDFPGHGASEKPLGDYSLGNLSLIHISEPTRQAEISYAVFCLKKKKKKM